jgi:hypothetical protein
MLDTLVFAAAFARTILAMPMVWHCCFVLEESSLLRGASSGVALSGTGRGTAVSGEYAGADDVDSAEWK